MGLFGGLSRKQKLRQEAEGHGLVVTEVERALPTITGNGQLESLEMDHCARYALSRAMRGGSNWSLLQRDRAHGAQLPNGFLVESPNVTPALLDALRPVAEEFAEGYFEFEGVPGEVAAFWDEGGDKSDVERLYRTLASLRDI